MRYRVSDGTSDYKGMTVSVTRRQSHGLTAQASYTFSKSEDDGASALGGTDFTNEAAGGRYLYDNDFVYSPFDVRHSVVISANYLLPFAANATGVRGALAKGWTIGTLIRARSGYPFSALSGVDTGLQVQGWAPAYPDLAPGADPNPILGRVDRWFDPTAFVLPATGYIGTLPRNTLTGPNSRTVDIVGGKTINVGGNREIQIRLECFNLFNRANFGTPQNSVFNTDGSIREDAGRITTTSTAGRQVQIGAKFVF
jgi:hypothetical protein